MKLLFLLDNYWPHIGGVETAFKTLCEGLVTRGHVVTVITHRPAGTLAREERNGVKIVRLACLSNRYVFTIVALAWVILRRPKADVIHTTTFNAAPAAWLAGRLNSIPVILTVNETWIGRWREYSNFSWPKVVVHELLERAVFSIRYDRYVGISNATSERLKAVLPRARNRISTIYYGFDAAPWKFVGDEASLKARYGLEERFVVLGYGRPGTSKGFEWFVDAIPAIRRRIPRAAFVLILSDGRQYSAELKRIKQRAGDNVMFLPSLSFNDLIAHVRAMDCVVVPSLAEGFGYTTLEAVASGTPVVAANVGSIPEVIGGRYQLVEPRDGTALAEALARIAAGKVSARAEKAFSWSGSISAYETLYGVMIAS